MATTPIQPSTTVVAAIPTNLRRKRTLTTPIARSQGGTTVYFYRELDGTRGSATSVGEIPSGAVVERVVTS